MLKVGSIMENVSIQFIYIHSNFLFNCLYDIFPIASMNLLYISLSLSYGLPFDFSFDYRCYSSFIIFEMSSFSPRLLSILASFRLLCDTFFYLALVLSGKFSIQFTNTRFYYYLLENIRFSTGPRKISYFKKNYFDM